LRVSAETPEASSKLTLLQLLPATQGIYGFVIAIVIMAKIGIELAEELNILQAAGMNIRAQGVDAKAERVRADEQHRF